MADTVTTNLVINVEAEISKAKKNIDKLFGGFNKYKLPKGFDSELEKATTNLYSAMDKWQSQAVKGFTNRADLTKFIQQGKEVEREYANVERVISKLFGKEIKPKIDSTEITNLTKELDKALQKRSELVTQFNSRTIKNPYGNNFKGGKMLNEMINVAGDTKSGQYLRLAKESVTSGDFDGAVKSLLQGEQAAKKFGKAKQEAFQDTHGATFVQLLHEIIQSFVSTDSVVGKATTDIDRLNNELNQMQVGQIEKADEEFRQIADSIREAAKEQGELNKAQEKEGELRVNREDQINSLKRQVEGYFGLSQIIRKVGNIARQAFQTVKELDAAMVETAVVTNFDVGDMWEMLPEYTKNANQLGSTIKDVYEAATLYYQQGLNTTQAMGLANETLKMARIGGLQAAEATNMMTAALRGFNMQINETSARKINDVYSELAAVTASDTRELGSAMERTASIANSANMAFETTSAFLAQMIETTREAPENLGTAMKTIVARFQEMKQDPTKLIDAEGEMMDANRVDKALKTIGISLMDTNGQFRNLDEVFLEISEKWDSLTQAQQRYIATIAAGSRQQSRFIAMVGNHERLMELIDASTNSAGASQRQFNKTLEGMDAKLNKLKNAWDQFTMGLANQKIIKGSVDALTGLLTVVNKIFDEIGKIPDPFGGITKSITTLGATILGLNLSKIFTKNLIEGFVTWWGGKNGGLIKSLKTSFFGTDGLQAYFTKEMASVFQVFNKSDFIKKLGTTKIGKKIKFDGLIKSAQATGAAIEATAAETGAAVVGTAAASAAATEAVTGSIGAVTEAVAKQVAVESLKSGATASAAAEAAALAAKDAAVSFEAVAGAEAQATAAGASFMSTLAPLLVVFASLAAGYLTFKLYDAQFNKNANALAKMNDVAAATSDIYSTVSQNLSELRDNTLKLQEIEDGFEGLAAGTVAFNEQLSKSNELILELLKKYPMLNDYLEFDARGALKITEKGLKEVAEFEENIRDHALSMSIIANGRADSQQTLTDIEDKTGISTNSSDRLAGNRVRVYRGVQVRQTTDNDRYKDLTDDEKKEYDFALQRAEAQKKSAYYNGIMADLGNEDLENQKEIAEWQANRYETLRKTINLSKERSAEIVAEYYNYTYENGKFMSGDEEVDLTKEQAVEIAPDIVISQDLEKNAVQIDKTISNLNKQFKKGLKKLKLPVNVNEIEGADDFIGNLMAKSTDASEDLIQYLKDDFSAVEKVVNTMDAEELSYFLNEDAEKIKGAEKKYREVLIEELKQNREEIEKAQEAEYSELAGMFGAAKYGGVPTADRNTLADQKKVIKQQMESFTAEQRKTMLQVGKGLQESSGLDSTKIVIRSMQKMYTDYNNAVAEGDKKAIEETEKAINDFQEIIDGVNWDSPTERLIAFHDLTKSTSQDLKDLGNSLLESPDSANLLTESFGEMYNSEAFIEASKDAKDFMDSTGRYTAAGILEMSKSVGTMNQLLEEGIWTSGGLAMALNTLGGEGDLTFMDLNDNILTLLNSFGELDSVIGATHQTIKNFNPGLDTGEGEDFYKEQVENFKELYKNGEWGNPQMEAYAKLFIGEDNWNTAIENARENGESLEEVYKDIYSKINLFRDGFYDAWEKLATSDKLDPEGIISKNADGSIHLDLSKESFDTADEIVEYLQKQLKISKEAAEAMLTDYANYSGDLREKLDANAFYEGFKNTDYLKQRTNDKGQVQITESELKTIAKARNLDPKEDMDKLIDEVNGVVRDITKNQEAEIKVIDNLDEKGNFRTDYENLNKELSQQVTGKEDAKAGDYLKVGDYLSDTRKGVISFEKAANDLVQNMGYGQEQAYGMIFEEMQKDKTQFEYNGVLLDPSEFSSVDQLTERLAEIDENAKWVEVGKSIAQGIEEYDASNGGVIHFTPKKKGNATEGQQFDSSPQATKNYGIGLDTSKTDKQIGDYLDSFQEKHPKISAIFDLEDDNVSGKVKQLVNGQHVIEFLFKGDDTEAKETADNFVKKHPVLDILFNPESEQVHKEIRDVTKDRSATINFSPSGLTNIATTISNLWKKWKEMKGGNGYTGLSNKIPTTHVPLAGSLANGKKGRVGPKNKGGLTLTGEQGYEIAWLPSENRSMILGANGPQMINLPKDAVVYNHEQSKDIFKRKSSSIKAGSLRAGSSADSYGGKTGIKKTVKKGTSTSSGNNSKNSKGDKDKSNKITINNWSIEEIVRFNLDQRITGYQRKVDEWSKSLDKALELVGKRFNDVSKNFNNQISYLNKIKAQNDKLVKSYEKDLKKLDTGNYKTRVSYTNKKGESKEFTANLSKYIYKNSDGTYGINKDKIKKDYKTNAQREAVFNAAKSALDPLVSGLNSAKDAATAAKDAMEELQKKMYDNFFGWKNELTEIYNLTQRIANDDSFRTRFASAINLELARLGAGFSTVSDSVSTMSAVLQRSNQVLVDQVKNQRTMMAARERELADALNYVDELDKLGAVRQKKLGSAAEKQASEEYTAATLMRKYVTDLVRNSDGSITYNIDWEQFERDQRSNPYSEETYNAIKQQLDGLNEAAVAFNNSIKDTTDLLAEVYKSLSEYRKTVADFEATLIKQLEDNLKKQIDNAKKLSTSLKDALKNILDEVKRRLQERRQKEDNAKTEEEIAKKQQRLTALRANTSAGNQVEIAQLEKEIANAQQSYQRTLEDQLLNRLQEQGDIAARQRERQIELLEAQLEVSQSTNKELVALWLTDPEKYATEIERAWMEANKADEKGAFGLQVLQDNFSKTFAEVQSALTQLDSANEGGLAYFAQTLELGLQQVSDDWNRGTDVLSDTIERNVDATTTGAQHIVDSIEYLKNTLHLTSAETIKALESEGVDVSKGSSTYEAVQNAYATPKTTTAATPAKKADTKTPKKATKTASTAKKVTEAQMKAVAASIWKGEGWGSGSTRKKRLTAIFGPNSAKKIQDYVNKGEGKYTYKKGYSYNEQKKKTYKKYRGGGLADFTGPAWLDGTPSKPEIVLNATDAKNFVQLRDILSSVMKNDHLNEPVAVGDTNYEININVDHIANDYDVDRIAAKVKKEIVESSQYRNVNQIRRLR